MEIQIVGTTNNIRTKEEFLSFGRTSGRVCYSKYDFKTLTQERDNGLVNTLVQSGHHSPFDHAHITMYIENIPKIIAMILNNERPHATSEKSARYTKMKNIPEKEKQLYEKWIEKLTPRIADEYIKNNPDKVKKLAQENARYMTSIFTPTSLVHTISFRQLNVLMNYFKEFIDTQTGKLEESVKKYLKEFNSQLDFLYVPELKNNNTLSFFSESQKEVIDTSYSINYEASFAAFAQLHRHRTLNHSITGLTTNYFVPLVAEKEEWLEDIASVEFPQGQLIMINEKGQLDNFKIKLIQRLCAHAQYEVMNISREQINKFAMHTNTKEHVLKYSKGPACTFPNFTCPTGCIYGKKGLERII